MPLEILQYLSILTFLHWWVIVLSFVCFLLLLFSIQFPTDCGMTRSHGLEFLQISTFRRRLRANLKHVSVSSCNQNSRPYNSSFFPCPRLKFLRQILILLSIRIDSSLIQIRIVSYGENKVTRQSDFVCVFFFFTNWLKFHLDYIRSFIIGGCTAVF